MEQHPNARLAPKGRETIVSRIVNLNLNLPRFH